MAINSPEVKNKRNAETRIQFLFCFRFITIWKTHARDAKLRLGKSTKVAPTAPLILRGEIYLKLHAEVHAVRYHGPPSLVLSPYLVYMCADAFRSGYPKLNNS